MHKNPNITVLNLPDCALNYCLGVWQSSELSTPSCTQLKHTSMWPTVWHMIGVLQTDPSLAVLDIQTSSDSCLQLRLWTWLVSQFFFLDELYFLPLFSEQPFFGGSTSINQISGKIKSGEEVLASLDGHWVRNHNLLFWQFRNACTDWNERRRGNWE